MQSYTNTGKKIESCVVTDYSKIEQIQQPTAISILLELVRFSGNTYFVEALQNNGKFNSKSITDMKLRKQKTNKHKAPRT